MRLEIQTREDKGCWIAGAGGVNGAYPMRSQESRDRRAAAADNDDVSAHVSQPPPHLQIRQHHAAE